MSTYSMSNLMSESGVKFGTSGARGLVTAMTDKLCFLYTQAFIQHLEESGQVGSKTLGLGGDLRQSSPRIIAACAQAALAKGWAVEYMGLIPSPAVALRGIEAGMATAMVTGSHIPEDRNGIKFNTPTGEITKVDEGGILKQEMHLENENLFNVEGAFAKTPVALSENKAGIESYKKRYLDFFGPEALKGLNLGVYQHSTVGREVLVEILASLGADVEKLGWSDIFISVDTEAIRPEDRKLAVEWGATGKYDGIMSADGDCDRPLLSDEKGEWIPGDVLGILASKALGIEKISTPVSCNTALEKAEAFVEITRTRIGSPFVIAGMEAFEGGTIAGYEANGGFLLGSDLTSAEGQVLKALATRDAVLPVVAVLVESKALGKKVSEIAASIPPRFTASDRLKEFPTETSQEILAKINENPLGFFTESFEALQVGSAVDVEGTDGLRCTFDTKEIIHLRPSGNAPEFRCYVETDSKERSEELKLGVLKIMESWR